MCKVSNENVNHYSNLFSYLENLFITAIKYHKPTNFDPVWSGSDSEKQILNSYHSLWSWFQDIQSEFIENRNGLIKELSLLFHRLHPHTFFSLRDFLIDLNDDIIDNLGKQNFFFGNTPFKDDIFNLGNVILKNHPDKKIELKLKTYQDFESKNGISEDADSDLITINSKRRVSQVLSIEIQHNLSMKQIALKHIYEDKTITRDNANQIAKEYGYISKTSGESLYQDYSKFIRNSNRKGDEGSKRKNQYKINLIKSVVEMLPEDKRKKPKSEVIILEEIQKNDY